MPITDTTMKVKLDLMKRLFAFSAGDFIVFGGVGTIVLIVFVELGLPFLGMAAAVLGGWLGWALERAMNLNGAPQRELGSEEESLTCDAVHGIASADLDGPKGWVQRVLEIAPTDLDGLGS